MLSNEVVLMGSEDRLSDLKDLDESSQDQDDESDEDEQSTETATSPKSGNGPDVDDKSGGESDADGKPDAETETESTPSMTTTEDESETTTNESASPSASVDISESEPPYSGDEYSQHTIYTMEETWNEYDDAMGQMEYMTLRQQFDIRNLAARELNEAMVRLASDYPELVAERVLEARGYDVDLSDE